VYHYHNIIDGRDSLKQAAEKQENQKKPKKGVRLKTVLLFTAEIVILWMIFHYCIFLAAVPSTSMVPTIPKNSLSVITYLHGEKQVERGDCVVFWSDEFGKRLVKRVVGLPGEEVSIDEEGTVFIDGERLEEEYVENQYAFPQDFVVPEGCYLFLGDNRLTSDDARFWADPYIPSEKLIGKVQLVLWPLTAVAYLG
jgi:signal peptidase I